MGRELRDYRACGARLRTAWTEIPGVAAPRPLWLHERFADHAERQRPPVVLVHGYGIGSRYFVPLAGRLADHVHVHALDLPGHGRSDHDARPLTIPELGDALAAWLSARQIRGAVLVGHSLGAHVVVEAAARHPGHVAALLLIGPACDPAARSVLRLTLRAALTAPFERPTFAVWAVIDWSRAGLPVLVAEMRSMLDHQAERLLPHVTVPVRVLRGARDRLAPKAWAEAVARLASAPPPVRIRGWGHAVHYDDPDAVACVLLELTRCLDQ